MMVSRFLILLLILAFLSACVTSPPKHTENICQIFREKGGWYEDSKDSFENWGIPIHVQMAIMHQESRFVADARPPRPWLLGFIPWFRSSSAYGYAQAQDDTWDDYLNAVGSWSADRDEFDDASDFIGWYCHISHQKLHISKKNTANLYLAYHEGHGGFRRKTYLKKPWLIRISKKVAKKARHYQAQLKTCEQEFKSNFWFF